MTEKVAWVTDSTGFLDEDLLNHEDVYVIPIKIHMEDQDFSDGVDVTHENIFEAMNERKAVVTTSQPSVGEFQYLYNQLHEKGYHRVYSFLISEKLSGTFSSSMQASQLVQIPIHTFDSQLLSYPMTYIMKKAITLQKRISDPEELMNKLTAFRDGNETLVLIGSLDQLYRSGRLSSVKYYLGNILKIKPIIALAKGKLEIQHIARNEKHAEKIIFSALKNAVEQNGITECMILYGQFKHHSESWVNRISQLYPRLKLHICPLGTAIGVHAGGRTLGISWFKEKI